MRVNENDFIPVVPPECDWDHVAGAPVTDWGNVKFCKDTVKRSDALDHALPPPEEPHENISESLEITVLVDVVVASVVHKVAHNFAEDKDVRPVIAKSTR